MGNLESAKLVYSSRHRPLETGYLLTREELASVEIEKQCERRAAFQ